jgi:ANTAR domain-containing protein
MKIGAALAADFGILTAALDEPGADVLRSLHQLGVDAQAAMPTYLGLSITVDGSDPPFTFTTLEDGAADDVRTSLRLMLPGVGDRRASLAVTLTLYAGTPGTFVDLTADLAWLTGRPPSDFSLDRHLTVPAGSDTRTHLRAASVINQAIGVLIGRGYTPGQAHRELDTQADSAGTDRHATAQLILDTLTAEDPADAKHTDQEPNIG